MCAGIVTVKRGFRIKNRAEPACNGSRIKEDAGNRVFFDYGPFRYCENDSPRAGVQERCYNSECVYTPKADGKKLLIN